MKNVARELVGSEDWSGKGGLEGSEDWSGKGGLDGQ